MSTDEASSKKNPSPEAASCTLQGADYADYLLQAAKDKYLRVLHSGIENLGKYQFLHPFLGRVVQANISLY